MKQMMQNKSSSSRGNKRLKGGIFTLLSIYLIFAVFSGDEGGSALSRSSLADRSLTTKGDLPRNSDDNSNANRDNVKDPNLSAWVVIYDHFRRSQGETETQMLSYRMFHNREVYQKILYVWDSSQNDDIDFLNRYIPELLRDDIITIDVATEMSAEYGFDIKADFASVEMSNNCFGRGRGYCEMLYIKMNLDVAVRAAALKYGLQVPEIMGIADGDAYWQSLPVKDNVIDPAGRIIFHTISCANYGGYAEGVGGMLPGVGAYMNGMAAFPMHVWMDTLPAMRQKIVEIKHEESMVGESSSPGTFHEVFSRYLMQESDDLGRHLTQESQEHGQALASGPGSGFAPVQEEFLNVFVKNEFSLCEFCVMATYAFVFEPERYRFTQRPCPAFNRTIAGSNAFLDDSPNPMPMVYMMRHEKARHGPLHPVFNSTLNIWVYGCCLTYGITADEAKICEGKVPDGYSEMMGHHEFFQKPTGYTSPTMMTDHFERVFDSVERRLLYENLESKAACLRQLDAVAEKYSQCTTC